MDILLDRVTSQAMSLAIRSGITVTATYAIKQCTRLLQEAPRGKEHQELLRLQIRLESKIRIVSPAIDMIELIAARGNTSLESAVSLTRQIRYEVQSLGTRLSQAASAEESQRKNGSLKKSRTAGRQAGLQLIIDDINTLLVRIEDAIPLINLAITTSGVNLSTKLSNTISPSRLLQASTFLTAADASYTANPDSRQQVGPTYTLSVYMLFGGHTWRPTDQSGVREMTWKEVIHKARVKLLRVPLEQVYDLPGQSGSHPTSSRFMHGPTKSAEFAYQLLIVEDLDDDRVHTTEDDSTCLPFDEVPKAGIRDIVPIHEVSKLFYADTGKILNIGGDDDTYNPVLLLRRDVHAEPPRRMYERSQASLNDLHAGFFDLHEDGNNRTNEQSGVGAETHKETMQTPPSKDDEASSAWRFPADLDPEWLAFEVYSEDSDSESDSDDYEQASKQRARKCDSLGSGLSNAMSKMDLKSEQRMSISPATSTADNITQAATSSNHPPIKTTLSLLEMLIKLTALQQYRQESHLSIEDEMINFFLEDSATAGAGGNRKLRQRIRQDAARRVGFDPYDESPVKRRGEEYIINARRAAGLRSEASLSLDHDGSTGRVFRRSDGIVREVDQTPSTGPEFRSSPTTPPALQMPPLWTSKANSENDRTHSHDRQSRLATPYSPENLKPESLHQRGESV